MAVKHETGDSGFGIWNSWSQGSDAYNAGDARDVWKSIKADGGVSGGTLFREAKANGWRDDGMRQKPTPEELAERKRDADERAARDAEDAACQQADTAQKAAAIWNQSVDAAGNPYLARKGVATTEALRQIETEAAVAILGYRPKADGRLLAGLLLVVPLCRDGELVSLELIDGSGIKTALKGRGTKSGAYWTAQPLEGIGGPIIVAEGVATALSIKESTRLPVVSTGSASNFTKVISAIRAGFNQLHPILAADLDKQTGQPVAAAIKASRQFSPAIPLVAPDFGIDRPAGATDFNDLHQTAGIDVLHDTLARLLANYVRPSTNSGVTDVTDVTASNIMELRGYINEKRDVTDVTRLTKPAVDRPGFAVHDDWTGFGKPGVWWHGTRERGDELAETDQWICSPLHADAITHGDRDSDFGLLLRFKNALGRWREWAMPMAMLRGAAEEARGELLGLGVRIDPTAHRLLNQYLMSRYPEARVLAATNTGWHEDGQVFVLPHRVIGAGNVCYQSEHADHDEFTQIGTFDGWRTEIAAQCAGNPMLILAVSAALTGPLLARVHRAGCGLHFYGDSSIGKSTLLALSASCWGGSGFVRTWRATSNGIEGTAAMLNDTVLILDEISEADPREIGAIVYCVANGTGKSRAARTGGARAVKRWRVVLLSSGERTLLATMEEAGRRAKAGQEARLLDIPCTRQHGVFDVLRGFDGGRALADALKTQTSRHHGHAGPAFIEQLIADDRDLGETLAKIVALSHFAADSGIEGRAAGAFALIALAGELAIEWGIVPWSEGEALDAAALAFRLWREHRGAGQTETRQILRSVADFIARHGDARFSPLRRDSDFGIVVRDRAGWWKLGPNEERIYLFTPGALREAAGGFDQRRILEALDSSGWLAERDPGQRSKVTRAQGRSLRLYAIAPRDGDAT